MATAKLTIPTGYESQQRSVEAKRALAKMMLEAGMQPNGNMQSWLQVLGQMGQHAAGLKLSHDADKLDDNIDTKRIKEYATHLGAFKADVAAGKSPEDIVNAYGSDPLLEADVKPYVEAMTAGLKERGEHTNFGGQWRAKGAIKEGEYEPNKPTDSVLRGPGNTFLENPVRRSAALHAQGYDMGGEGVSMPDPGAPIGPVPPVSGPVGEPNDAPGGTPAPPGNGPDLSLLSGEERDIIMKELARRAAGNGGFTPPNASVPMGSPLTAQRAPAGAVNGKPYWIINGVPYDNPEGK